MKITVEMNCQVQKDNIDNFEDCTESCILGKNINPSYSLFRALNI